MIIKEFGTEKIVCDSCDVSEHIIEGDFSAEIAIMKDDGWKITRPEGQWRHECPECVGASSRLTLARKRFGLL